MQPLLVLLGNSTQLPSHPTSSRNNNDYNDNNNNDDLSNPEGKDGPDAGVGGQGGEQAQQACHQHAGWSSYWLIWQWLEGCVPAETNSSAHNTNFHTNLYPSTFFVPYISAIRPPGTWVFKVTAS